MIARAVLLAVALAAPAAATPTPQQELRGDDVQEVARGEADRMLQMYAECLVKRGAKVNARIDTFVRMPTDDAEFYKAGMKLVEPDCMPRTTGQAQMRLQAPLLRAALFDARYRQAFRDTAPEVSAVPPLSLASEFDGPVGNEERYLRTMGDCIARVDGASSRALVLAKADSDAANMALGRLRPALGKCVAEGSTVRFSRGMLRGVVAEALYKLSVAANAAPARATPMNAN